LLESRLLLESVLDYVLTNLIFRNIFLPTTIKICSPVVETESIIPGEQILVAPIRFVVDKNKLPEKKTFRFPWRYKANN